MKNVFGIFCFPLLILTLNSVAQNSSTAASQAVTTQNKQTTIISTRSAVHTPYVDENAGLSVIYSSLATDYPDGLYWCCQGSTVSGPNSPILVEWWEAAAFTPGANTTAAKVQVAIGFIGGNDKELILSLNADQGGVPGAVLEQWVLSGLEGAGTCCSVESKAVSGVALTGGQQYWIVASTGPNSDVWASWNQADSDQIDSFLNAGYTNQFGTPSWQSFETTPNLAFAVYGK